jgi:hypothetical protein
VNAIPEEKIVRDPGFLETLGQSEVEQSAGKAQTFPQAVVLQPSSLPGGNCVPVLEEQKGAHWAAVTASTWSLDLNGDFLMQSPKLPIPLGCSWSPGTRMA